MKSVVKSQSMSLIGGNMDRLYVDSSAGVVVHSEEAN